MHHFPVTPPTSPRALPVSSESKPPQRHHTEIAPVNLRFTFKPAAITYPKTANQISEIVKLGAVQNLPVVARSGGHSYIANGLGGRDGALVVDLRNFNKITINSSKGTALIESGNRLGDVALALGKAGRGLPHGNCPYVGIGGHAGVYSIERNFSVGAYMATAYGGFGYASRMWGLTLDTIVAANIVLANGTVVRSTRQDYPDLFWSLRGSAGSFGITTFIEVTTFPSPASATAFQYDWDLNATSAASGLSAFQSFVQSSNLPSHFGAVANLWKGSKPDSLTFSISGAWYAPVQALNATLAPLLRYMPKPRTSFKTGSYLDITAFLSDGSLDTKSKPDSQDTFYAKSLMTPEKSPISDTALQAFTRYMVDKGNPSPLVRNNLVSKLKLWYVQVELYGGKNSAVNAVHADETAFSHRSSTFAIQFYASSGSRPFPDNGLRFMDDMVETLTSRSPKDWDYG
ncbi:hypothetical protein DXG03_006314, partial [Asterophora parasitica]